jgi:hypothetical protein
LSTGTDKQKGVSGTDGAVAKLFTGVEAVQTGNMEMQGAKGVGRTVQAGKQVTEDEKGGECKTEETRGEICKRWGGAGREVDGVGSERFRKITLLSLEVELGADPELLSQKNQKGF